MLASGLSQRSIWDGSTSLLAPSPDCCLQGLLVEMPFVAQVFLLALLLRKMRFATGVPAQAASQGGTE